MVLINQFCKDVRLIKVRQGIVMEKAEVEAFFFITIVCNFIARLSTSGNGTSYARTDNVTWL